jgi:hypothetical protein
VEQLTSIVRVSRELNSMVDLKSLLDVVREEAMRTTHAECGTILLFDLMHPPFRRPSCFRRDARCLNAERARSAGDRLGRPHACQ